MISGIRLICVLSKHLCLRRGVKINEGFKLRHTKEWISGCVCVRASAFMHVFAGICLKDVALCVLKSHWHYFCSIHCLFKHAFRHCLCEFSLHRDRVYTHLPPQGRPATMHLSVYELSPHLAMCVRVWEEQRWRWVWSSREMICRVYYLKLASRGKEIDKDPHLADGSALCLFHSREKTLL